MNSGVIIKLGTVSQSTLGQLLMGYRLGVDRDVDRVLPKYGPSAN